MREPRHPARARRPGAVRRLDGRSSWHGRGERHERTEGPGGWWVVVGETDQPPATPVVDDSMSKKQLYQEAKSAGITGRGAMNKQQLLAALRSHYGETSPPEVSDQEPVEPRPPSPRHRSQALDRCAIAYRESDGQGEFQVVVTGADGSHRSVARSPAFPASAGEIRRKGAARAAHELLVQRLLVCGWWPKDSGGEWPELEFVRAQPTDPDAGRSLVAVVRDGGRARFVADELDSFGNATPLQASQAFRAPALVSVRPSRQAKAAMKRLLARLEVDGWRVAGQVGDTWYAIALSRRSLRDGS